MDKINIVIVDDQKILTEGISALLSIEKGLDVVGCANSGEEALELLMHTPADIVLMDIRMPGMNGVECTGIIREQYPDIKIIILTTFDDDEYIQKGLKNGASGYMLKDLDATSLYSAIRDVYYGNNVIHKSITKRIVSGMSSSSPNTNKLNLIEDLTEREMGIAGLISEGLDNREIAKRLFLSEGTVKNYVSIIYDKTGIKGRSRLVKYLIQNGIGGE